MRTPIAVAALVASALGCALTTPTQAPPTTTSAVVAVAAAPASFDASGAEGPPEPPAPRCRVSVTDTEGSKAEEVEALLAPVRSSMEHCRGPQGGKLDIRVRQTPTGKLAFDVEPGSSLDPTEKECVLDALNTIQIDPGSLAWMGPSVPPTGFTSLLTIEW